MKILKVLEKNTEFWFIIITSFLFYLLRFPSLFEPYWYGDEGVYHAVGMSLNNGLLLYRDIFDNKPPLLYIIYSIFQSNLFLIKLLSSTFGILSIIFFFLLAKKLFYSFKNSNIPIYLSTSIFAFLFGLPLIEGNIANAENFMLLPIIIAAFLTVHMTRKPLETNQKSYILFIIGILLSLAFLVKIVATFDFAAIFVFLVISKHISIKNIKTIFKEFKLLFAGFLLPIVITSIFFLIKGAFLDFLNATLFTNIPYVGYGNKIWNLPVLLFIKGLLLLGSVTYIYSKRHVLDKTMIFIFIWLAFSLFNAFFSQRPYTHYVLVLLPSLSLLVGLIFSAKKYQKIILLLLFVVLLITIKNFRLYSFTKSFLYYPNFVSYIIGQKSTFSYQAFFDRNTPSDYEIALFIKPRVETNDKVFVWGNNAQVYKLIDVPPFTKYVVGYHMTNYKDGISATKNALESTRPKFIVNMSNQKPIPFSLINYSKKVEINNASIYERIL
ncbi:MAG: hypothetical protein HYT07_00605 [Candidatus Levybacteria bacterium]|nr:hypothetical protein [Candidatus Levybacteria bacterium]